MKYGYLVREDGNVPVLLRHANGVVETFDPREPGDWRDSPSRYGILSGDDDWVWFDKVSESDAEKYADTIRKFFRDNGFV